MAMKDPRFRGGDGVANKCLVLSWKEESVERDMIWNILSFTQVRKRKNDTLEQRMLLLRRTLGREEAGVFFMPLPTKAGLISFPNTI